MYAEVLIQYGVKSLDRTFTYKVPQGMTVNIGNKVKIPFANKEIYGIVLSIKESNNIADVKDIILILY